MAFSSSEFTGDGSTRVFSFSFIGPDDGYIRQSDIHVYVDGVEQAGFTFPTSNSVELATAPADGAKGLVRRIMPKEEPYSNFARGSNFSRVPVNNSFLQQLYTQHEVLDGYNAGAQQEDVDMNQNKIVNLADGTDPQDAVNYRQTIGIADEAKASADAAKVSETNSKASETNANGAEGRAEEYAKRAEEAARSSGLPLSSIQWFIEDPLSVTVRPGLIKPNGQLLKRSDYFALWERVEADNTAISEADWQGGRKAAYSTGDGSTTFRLPDVRGYFIRIPDDGAGVDPDSRQYGEPQDDEVGGHGHNITNTLSATFQGDPLPNHDHSFRMFNSGGISGTTRFPASAGILSQEKIPDPVDGASAGTPSGSITITGSVDVDNTTGSETRGKNVWFQPYIVFSRVDEGGTGLRFRGTWDADANIVYGDPLNNTLQKGVAPTVEAGSTPDRVAYLCIKGGNADIIAGPGGAPWVIGDQAFWSDTGNPKTWVAVPIASVSSVNGQTGVIVLDADDVGAYPKDSVWSRTESDGRYVAGSTQDIGMLGGSIKTYGSSSNISLVGNTYSFVNSALDTHMGTNAYWDASGWKKYDDSLQSCTFIISNDNAREPTFNYSKGGSPDANQYNFPVHHDGGVRILVAKQSTTTSAGDYVVFNTPYITDTRYFSVTNNSDLRLLRAGLYRICYTGVSKAASTRAFVGANGIHTSSNNLSHMFSDSAYEQLVANVIYEASANDVINVYVGAGSIYSSPNDRFGEINIEYLGLGNADAPR